MALGSHPTRNALEKILPEAWVAGGSYDIDLLDNLSNPDCQEDRDMYDLHEDAKRLTVEELLENVDSDVDTPLDEDSKGKRVWPEGYVGSVTDKRSVILAAMAEETDVETLGIDLELNESEGDTLDYIVTGDGELPPSFPDSLSLLAAFSVKEAVFKAYYHLEKSVIDFGDIKLTWMDVDSVMSSGNATCPHMKEFTIRCLNVNEWIVAAALRKRK